MRCINNNGIIFEASFSSDEKLNGWCISYIGYANQIHIGWYLNNKKHGNWMSLDGTEMTIKESGWYENNQRVGPMRRHHLYKMFTT